MKEYSEIKMSDVLPLINNLNALEVRINGRTEFCESGVDVFYDRKDYSDLATDYYKRARRYLKKGFKNLRITAINITIVDGHHSIVDLKGYYEFKTAKDLDEEEEDE